MLMCSDTMLLQIASILTHIAAKENLALDATLSTNIAEESSRNLRRAILMLESAKVKLSVAHATVIRAALNFDLN